MLDLQVKIAAGKAGVDAVVRPRALAQIQAELAPGQVLVVYHQLPQRLISWTLTKDSLRSSATEDSADAVEAL